MKWEPRGETIKEVSPPPFSEQPWGSSSTSDGKNYKKREAFLAFSLLFYFQARVFCVTYSKLHHRQETKIHWDILTSNLTWIFLVTNDHSQYQLGCFTGTPVPLMPNAQCSVPTYPSNQTTISRAAKFNLFSKISWINPSNVQLQELHPRYHLRR